MNQGWMYLLIQSGETPFLGHWTMLIFVPLNSKVINNFLSFLRNPLIPSHRDDLHDLIITQNLTSTCHHIGNNSWNMIFQHTLFSQEFINLKRKITISLAIIKCPSRKIQNVFIFHYPCISQLSLPTTWVLGMELRLLVMTVDSFTQSTISSSQTCFPTILFFAIDPEQTSQRELYLLLEWANNMVCAYILRRSGKSGKFL